MRLHKELHRESLEREDGGVENNAQRHDQPVTHAELPQVGEDYFVRGDGSQAVVLLGPFLHEPVNDCAHQTECRESQRDEKRRSPVGVSRARPGR